ncbi:cytosolic acyl coenzyme A thioester hydrolase [Pteropus alecto]|nr:cytosolic acyl coenzyme A thioester hydrolase [Pteropus alecto]
MGENGSQRTTPVFLHGRRLDGLDGGPQRKRQIGSGPVSHRRTEGSFKVTLYSFGQNRKQGTLVFERAGSSFFSESRWILWRTSSSPGVVTVPSAVLSRGLILPLLSPLPRIMRPDDANMAGSVHGGTILKMIEEAGAIISTRHCNSQSSERCVAVLARVERTDFLSPVCIGEVAHVSAEITYTSKHSVEVQVNVMSENIVTGIMKLTNKATLWYVPLSLEDVDRVLEVPPVVYSRQEQEQEGRRRYEAQKLERMGNKWRDGDIVQPVPNPEPNTVSYSQSSLIYLVGPSDCTLHGFVHGGVTMKLMDDVAGIVAARHCKTNVVTASVDAINFHDKIKKGYVITISGRMTFTSNKSMEIEVLVDADPLMDDSRKRYRAASAFFTYVSLSQEGKSLPVPQLVPETEDEKKRFEEGKGRYLQMKAKRQGTAEPQP